MRVILFIAVLVLSSCAVSERETKYLSNLPPPATVSVDDALVFGGHIELIAELREPVRYLASGRFSAPEGELTGVGLTLNLGRGEVILLDPGVTFKYENESVDFAYDNAGTVRLIGPYGTNAEAIEFEGDLATVDHVNRPEERLAAVSRFDLSVGVEDSIGGNIHFVEDADIGMVPSTVSKVLKLTGLVSRSCVRSVDGQAVIVPPNDVACRSAFGR